MSPLLSPCLYLVFGRGEQCGHPHPSQVSSVVRRTTSQQKGQTLVLLCYSPATNQPVKFPDQSGHRPHDTGNPRMINCVHLFLFILFRTMEVHMSNYSWQRLGAASGIVSVIFLTVRDFIPSREYGTAAEEIARTC